MYQSTISLFVYKCRLSSVVESQLTYEHCDLCESVKQCVRAQELSVLEQGCANFPKD
jgi:hypothetical protein